MTARVLVVCTANVCRSPVAERLLARRLSGLVDLSGRSCVVASAGTHAIERRLDRNTVAAAAAAGIDVTDHRPRRLDREVLATDGADLVLTMTREHLRHVVAVDAAAWPRTFTLKQLARLGLAAMPPAAEEDLAAWLARVGAERRPADLLRPAPDDDVADPFGMPRPHHDALVRELEGLIATLTVLGAWRRDAAGSTESDGVSAWPSEPAPAPVRSRWRRRRRRGQ